MTWTTQDTARLRRVLRRHKTDTAAAKALGIPRSNLSRYLSGERKPAGNLAEEALRARIARELGSKLEPEESSSGKDAER